MAWPDCQHQQTQLSNGCQYRILCNKNLGMIIHSNNNKPLIDCFALHKFMQTNLSKKLQSLKQKSQ